MTRRKGGLLLLAGAVCLLAALGLTGWNLYEQARAGETAQAAAEQLVEKLVETPEEPEEPEEPDPNRPMPVVEVDGLTYIGLLEIPALERTLPVLSEWSEANAKTAPCRYQGSLYQGDLIIAGHNYRSHFAHLNQLAAGAEVRFRDLDGNVWTYTVAGTEIIDGNDVERMEAGDWDLTLFTCTYGGQERFTVRCALAAGL